MDKLLAWMKKGNGNVSAEQQVSGIKKLDVRKRPACILMSDCIGRARGL